MEFFRNTRVIIARLILKKRSKKIHRLKKFNSLKNTHKIGIIWDGNDPLQFPSITSFYQEMQSRGIQVDILCYYPGKILPDDYTALRYLTCFKRADLKFFYIPNLPEITEFINTPYEIIIDINFTNQFPLSYITTLSKAEFKVGASNTSNDNIFDMTIEISDKSDVSYFLEQVKFYLEMISTGV